MKNANLRRCPPLSSIDISKIELNYRGKDQPELTELIRVAKFSKHERERERARHHLTLIYKKAVVGQASSYIKRGTAGKGVSIPPNSALMRDAKQDIISAAWEGFFRALELFDPDSGVPFRGYYHFHVQHRCTKEFYVLTNHLSGTDNKLWRNFLSWCGKQNRSDVKKLTWGETLVQASKSIGCEPEALNEIVRARKWNSAGVNQFVEQTSSPDERRNGGVIGVQSECDSYVWNVDKRFREPGEVDRALAWDNIETRMKSLGRLKNPPTRIEAAKEIAKMFDSEADPKLISKQLVFVTLYRQYISEGTDSSILANRSKNEKQKKAKVAKRAKALREYKKEKLRKVGGK